MTVAKVFISYRRIPSAMLATLIAKELELRGVEVYVDTRKGDGGGPFPRHLLQAIEDSDIFVCLLANTTFESDWVKREIDHAFTMGKTMIPVFQESFKPLSDTPDMALETLLMSQGVHVLDQQNIYVDEAIERLAAMIESSMPEPAYSPGDTTEIGERTYSLRPDLPKSRRWLWLVVALLIIGLGIFLFQWVNTPIINAAVAGTQTAIALAGVATETPTPTDTPTPPLTPSDAPSATLRETPTAPMFVVNQYSAPIHSSPNGASAIINTVQNQQLAITGISEGGNYYRVEFDGQIGWVHSSYGEVEGNFDNIPVILFPTRTPVTPFFVVDEYRAPLRLHPCSNSGIVETINNSRLPIIGLLASGDYYRVLFDDQELWVHSSYGDVEGDLSAVPVVENENC